MGGVSAEFDWAADDSVIALPQESVAVYTNRAGQAVIRRERAWDEEEDVFIVLSVHLVPLVVDRLLAAVGLEAGTAVTGTKAKNATGAERQKRYRRRRNGVTGDGSEPAVDLFAASNEAQEHADRKLAPWE